jgi:cobalamin synthase
MKKYFNNSTLYTSIGFVVYFLIDIYDGFNLVSRTVDVWNIINIVKSVLFITVILFFNRFTYISNRNKLFSKQAGRLWWYTGLVFLMIGLLCFVEARLNNGPIILFAGCMFLMTFCFAMRTIFNDAVSLNDENDLTI